MEMTRAAEMALLAAGSYWDIRRNIDSDKEEKIENNQAPIPEGWRVLSGEESHSGENVKWFGSGFSARAYRKGNEIVISYAGTETDDKGFFGFNHGSAQDFFRANFQLAVGAYYSQALSGSLVLNTPGIARP